MDIGNRSIRYDENNDTYIATVGDKGYVGARQPDGTIHFAGLNDDFSIQLLSENEVSTDMLEANILANGLASRVEEPKARPATWMDVLTDGKPPDPSPWIPPEFDPLTRKALNKLGEENSELTTVLFRIQNQTEGLDAIIPGETKTNRQWLEEEIADVFATSALAVKHLKLDMPFIEERVKKKTVYLEKWYMMLDINKEAKIV